MTSRTTGEISAYQCRLHLGAHKTGTTFLQAQLKMSRSDLRGLGVGVLGPDELRSRRIRSPDRRLARRPMLRQRQLRERGRMIRDLAGLVRSIAPDCSSVVVSDENLFAEPHWICNGQFYGDHRRILRVLGRLSEATELVVLFSTRSLDTFIPSLYAQSLRYSPPPMGGLPLLARRTLDDPPRWSRVVEKLADATHGRPLHMWCYEDLEAGSAEILELIAGAPCPVNDIEIPAVTRGSSAKAVALAERLGPSIVGDARARIVAQIYDELRDEDDPLVPFSSSEQQALRAAYDDDLARIRALPSVTLHHFR